ncbi:MAG: peptidoglycan-binding protein [Actinomycetota bacterium]|nr:peptidoglycan-binding protein [Acidimicrobiia bacterium]MDQ3293308.1 peptidoglycan-binding protein [Actinomycetota bacterium]
MGGELTNDDLLLPIQQQNPEARPWIQIAADDDVYTEHWTLHLNIKLTQLGYPVYESSLFDSHSEEAVKAFQRDYELDDDGIVGPDTWTTIEWALTGGRPDHLEQICTTEPPDPSDYMSHRDAQAEVAAYRLQREEQSFMGRIRRYDYYRFHGEVRDADRALFQSLDSDAEFGEKFRDLQPRLYDGVVRHYDDGHIETSTDHELRLFREYVQRGLRILESRPEAAIAYGVRKGDRLQRRDRLRHRRPEQHDLGNGRRPRRRGRNRHPVLPEGLSG